MCTEIGDDATDNYGEPLFQNQSDFIKDAITEFEDLINMEEKPREAGFHRLVKKYSPQNMENALLEKPRVSYNAIVLSALTTAYIQDAKEYKYAHSEYSAGKSSLYITQ